MDNPYQAPSANLETSADQAPLNYVGFWARTAAYIIDSLLILIIIVPVMYLTAGNLESLTNETETPGLAMMLLLYILPVVLIIGFWIWKGSTPGKMLFKGKIVDAKTGEKPSTPQFIGRYFGYILSSLPFGLGFFWIAWDKRKQGWHDKLSSTVVVKDN